MTALILLFSGVNESARLEDAQSAKRHRPKILVHPDTKDIDVEKTNVTKLILGLGSAAVFFITMCVVIAAIVARCQKRGRARRRQYDEPIVEFSKLVD